VVASGELEVSVVKKVVAAGVLASIMALTPGVAGAASAAGDSTYYVSVGDSAAVGFQPNGREARGYADQLYRREKSSFPQLRLVKLGCVGETTESFISGVGSPCGYPEGSQLDEATTFLTAHAGQVAFITITIGSNDIVNACLDPESGVIDLSCVERVMTHVQANLATILQGLRAAAPGVPIAGMSYWNPFLGFWVHGPVGEMLARADHAPMEAMNAGLVATYEDEGALVADVAGPEFFNIGESRERVPTRWGMLPVNVANACRWTWFCTRPPTGLDPHPNTDGYGVIADAFQAVLPG
jgi:lysophospholipase L1-like esterase